MTAKEILYKKCEEKGGCFLSGQVGWIVEAMEEYAALSVLVKWHQLKKPDMKDFPTEVGGFEYMNAMDKYEAEVKKIFSSKTLLETINKVTNDYRKTFGIK